METVRSQTIFRLYLQCEQLQHALNGGRHIEFGKHLNYLSHM